jgi:hypothetical protein
MIGDGTSAIAEASSRVATSVFPQRVYRVRIQQKGFVVVDVWPKGKYTAPEHTLPGRKSTTPVPCEPK